MNDHLKNIAQACLEGAQNGSMSFPEIVKTLIENGFESYRVDYVRHTVTYYSTEGASAELPMHSAIHLVGQAFDAGTIQSAIKEAQQQIEGYSYQKFSEKVTIAGCAGYIVSFPGRRVVYYGRTAELHVEHFPQ